MSFWTASCMSETRLLHPSSGCILKLGIVFGVVAKMFTKQRLQTFTWTIHSYKTGHDSTYHQHHEYHSHYNNGNDLRGGIRLGWRGKTSVLIHTVSVHRAKTALHDINILAHWIAKSFGTFAFSCTKTLMTFHSYSVGFHMELQL